MYIFILYQDGRGVSAILPYLHVSTLPLSFPADSPYRGSILVEVASSSCHRSYTVLRGKSPEHLTFTLLHTIKRSLFSKGKTFTLQPITASRHPPIKSRTHVLLAYTYKSLLFCHLLFANILNASCASKMDAFLY